MPMSEKDAGETICPVMSGYQRDEDGIPQFYTTACQTAQCQWWKWVDPERGQPSKRDPYGTLCVEVTDLPIGEVPEGRDWQITKSLVKDGVSMDKWSRPKIIGPRRGRCSQAVRRQS